MKNIFKYISLALISGVLFTSCDDDKIGTEASNLDFTPSAVSIFTAQSSYTLSESNIGEDNYIINIEGTIVSPQPIDVVFDFVKESGTANNDDFLVTKKLLIRAGETSGTTSIEILKTGDIEGDETLEIVALSKGNFTSNFTLPITITDDFINDNLDFSTTWSGTKTLEVASGEITFDFCNMDFDIALYDETASARIGYIGATASCTENGSISGLADGKYTIVAELFANPLKAQADNMAEADVLVPLTITYAQEYFSESKSFTFSAFKTTSAANDSKTLAEVEVKNGYIYAVTPL